MSALEQLGVVVGGGGLCPELSLPDPQALRAAEWQVSGARGVRVLHRCVQGLVVRQAGCVGERQLLGGQGDPLVASGDTFD